MAVQRTLICLAATALLMQLAMAANYTVGGPNGGWDATTNLQSWATSQSFSVSDNLIFRYASASHSVLEVNKADYDSCQTGNAIQSHTDGNTVITLSSPGKRYFICGAPGHCAGGMKVEIDTLATSSPPASSPKAPPPRRSTPPPRAPRSTPTPAASPSSPPSDSPVSSPEISSPSPAQSPDTAPTVSPTSPSSSPSGSPPPPGVPSTESPTTAPPPGSSSATKGVSRTSVTMGFSLGMLMLLSL